MILHDDQYDGIQTLTEAVSDGKKTYLTGVMSVANEKNRNGRIYSIEDLLVVERQINDAAKLNRHILGEISHPSTLDINLENVSHRMMEAWMESDRLMFKAEVLEKHPKGAIIKSLIDSGIQIGVSTRGAGSVNESTGKVSNYRFITLDCVANPSCPHSYPQAIREQLEMVAGHSSINTRDPMSQAYFQIQMKKFIGQLCGK